MKSSTAYELRQMSDDQIAAELADLRRRLVTLRTQAVTEKVEDNSQFRKIRRSIARLLTIQQERRAASAAGSR